ncbi:MAG: PA domain-containing protein [Pyrinomonadaceae bacterium]
MKRKKVGIGITLAASTLFLVGASSTMVLTQTADTSSATGRSAATDAKSGEAQEDVKVDIGGAQVAVDPRTGKLRQPTPEEARALAQSMQKLYNRSTKGLTLTRHPDGMKSVDLKGRFLNFSVANTNPDGTIATTCVSSAEEAAAFLGVQTKPSARPASPAKKSFQKSTKEEAHGAKAIPRKHSSLVVRLSMLAVLLLCTTNAFAGATIRVINVNAPGEGFNDPTPAAPVGGNPGTTVGQQRLIAFQFAADVWAATLDSSVEIRVQATFEPLSCSPTSGTLGAAGPITVFSDFPGTEFGNTFYSAALANKRAGFDLFPGPPGTNADDIVAFFNSNIGQPTCLAASSWYYGLNPNEAANQINLVAVLLHEFAHGLGFLSLVNSSTGTKFFGLDDIYMKYLLDNSTNKRWPEMTNAERQASAINFRRLVWDGANVRAAVPQVLIPGTPFLFINSPNSIDGTYLIGTASFGPPPSSSGLTGKVVVGDDGIGDDGVPENGLESRTDACTPLVNASAVNGNIALVDRGICGFTVKVKNAQNAGAIGVIVANNAPGSPPALGGADPSITIPTVSVTLADGNTIKGAIARGATVNVTIKLDLSVRAGADQANRALIYAPNPVQPGSSISHWDTIATPNQLMEPFASSDLTFAVRPPGDLTLPLFRDIGWFVDADGDAIPDGLNIFPPLFRATSTLARDCATGDYLVNITLTNVGPSLANNVQLTDVKLGGVLSTTLPQLYDTLRPGDRATRTLRFPGTAGAPGTRKVLNINGRHTTTFIGGSFSTGASKVLPACSQ